MIRTVPRALLDAATGTQGYGFVDADGGDRSVPYATLLDEARALAGALVARGLRRGDRIALIVPEADGFLRAFLGASLAGIVTAPLAYPFDTTTMNSYLATLARLVRAAGVRAIVTSRLLRPVLGSVQAAAPGIRFVVAWDDLTGAGLTAIDEPRADDAALLQFTSGSVAAPKGVVLTHANLAANVAGIAERLGLSHELDRSVSWLPLFHDMGLIGLALVPLYARGTTVFLSPAAFVKRPARWLAAISRHRGTISFAPTFAYAMCLRRIRDREMEGLDLSSWRVAGCGAEPVHAATLAAFVERFSPWGFRKTAFVAAYGLAESTLAVTLAPTDRGMCVDTVRASALTREARAVPCEPHDAEAASIVNCGQPFPGHTVRVVDDDGQPVPDRVVGEIVVTGPSVMREYLGDASQSGEALRDGALWTGDLGYLVDGDLHVCGRRKDTIVVHGRNYFPQDLEWAANQVTGVRPGRAAAFAATAPGQPDRVVVVVEADGSVTPGALEPAVRGRILEATGLAIDEVVVAAPRTIGRTTSGKVQRARLRDQYERGAKLALARDLLASQLGYVRVFGRQLGRRAGRRDEPEP